MLPEKQGRTAPLSTNSSHPARAKVDPLPHDHLPSDRDLLIARAETAELLARARGQWQPVRIQQFTKSLELIDAEIARRGLRR